MKTDYAAHDELYRQRRDRGRPGWDTPEQLRASFELLEKCLASPGCPRTGRLIELGSGAGEVSVRLARRGFDVTGVELSPTAVAWARERSAAEGIAVHFELADALDLPPHLRQFDLALDGHCFHCIVGPDRARFLAGARRVLRPGGLLLIRTMCGEVTSPDIAASFDPSTRCFMRGPIAFRYIGLPDDILTEIRTAGFAIQHSFVHPRTDAADQDELVVEAIA